MHWKIWYLGLETIEGETPEQWEQAPNDGVLCIGIRFGLNDDGIPLGEVMSGSDWYWMYNQKLYQSGTSSDIPNEWEPSGAPDGAVLKMGRWTSEEELAQADSEMMEWVTANG